MSMFSQALTPFACEVDVLGAMSMYAMVLASGKPSAIVDWNNNFGDDPEKAVLFHCSNFPAALLEEPRMSYQDIISQNVGKKNSWGTCVGHIKPTPVTFTRLTTDDAVDMIRGYVAEGEITDDKVRSFGGLGVAQVFGLQDLLAYACENGFEHHVAINPTHVGDAVADALSTYMGWDIYVHE